MALADVDILGDPLGAALREYRHERKRETTDCPLAQFVAQRIKWGMHDPAPPKVRRKAGYPARVLPTHMYRKSERYYLWMGGPSDRWIPLGRAYEDAIVAYNNLRPQP